MPTDIRRLTSTTPQLADTKPLRDAISQCYCVGMTLNTKRLTCTTLLQNLEAIFQSCINKEATEDTYVVFVGNPGTRHSRITGYSYNNETTTITIEVESW